MRTRFKKWANPFIIENIDTICNEDTLLESLKLKEFLAKDNLYLEIGSGKGQFAIDLAKKHPEKYFLCVEKVETVAAIFGKLLKEEQLENVYIVSSDIEKIFSLIRDKSIDIIFLNHSDPWPKKRHEKRRLTYSSFLKEYAKKLKDNGELVFKTDNDGLFEYSIESLENNNYILTYLNRDYLGDDELDAFTNYQRLFMEKDVKIKRLKAKYNRGDKENE